MVQRELEKRKGGKKRKGRGGDREAGEEEGRGGKDKMNIGLEMVYTYSKVYVHALTVCVQCCSVVIKLSFKEQIFYH